MNYPVMGSADSIALVKKMIRECSSLIINGRYWKVVYCTENYFCISNDDAETQVSYSMVDLNHDKIYKCVPMNP